MKLRSLFALVACLGVPAAATPAAPYQAPTEIKPIKIADAETYFATFQSHNQKVVENAYGVFMTYVYSYTDPPVNQTQKDTWRLARSLDGGKSFSTIWRSSVPTKAPVIETDEHGSVYLVHPNDLDPAGGATPGNATFYRFDPEKNYRDPLVRSIPQGSGGKFTMVFDPTRRQLYYMTFWDSPTPNFFALDLSGNVLFTRALTLPGSDSRLQYPHLAMSGPTLFAAWTTVEFASPYRYRAILYVYSTDGGQTWNSLGWGSLGLPIVADETGKAQLVSRTDELGTNPWLSNFIAKGSKLHFAYYSNTTGVQHYVRFGAGGKDLDVYPTWQAQSLGMRTGGGFFSTRKSEATGSLFMTGVTTGSHLGMIKSQDLGMSWSDHASSTRPSCFLNYAISGNRQLTQKGDILGQYTLQYYAEPGVYPPCATEPHRVMFFRTEAETYPPLQRDWIYFPLSKASMQAESGLNYISPLPTTVEHGSDASAGSYSKLRLFENGVEIGPAHSLHQNIRTAGAGRFSHWGSSLYFSSSDGSDPRTNAWTYQVAIPTRLGEPFTFYGRLTATEITPETGFAYFVPKDFATKADTSGDATASRLRLYEDGVALGTAHSLHSDIRSVGLGRYSHWGGNLYFASSDNTDPRTNGRVYSYRIEPTPGVIPCGGVLAANATQQQGDGYLFIVAQDFGIASDTTGTSSLRLFENGVELLPAHSLHADIRSHGGGRFSHWGSALYMSSSDGSDPRTNGRVYTWSGCS